MAGRGWLALRGLGAVVVTTGVAATLLARTSGHLDWTTDVYVGVPVAAGLISTQAPVRYHGVNVGRIAEIQSGANVSLVRLAMNSDAVSHIPQSVVARVVPRTFFGDIYLRLVDSPSGSTHGLAAGDTVAIDNSPDAMALYDMFTKIVTVFSQIKPERMQTALSAISQALRGRGQEIGSSIDDLSVTADALAPELGRLLDSTPQFRDVLAALNTATPDIITTLSAATNVANRMVADRGFTPALEAVAGFGSLLTSFLNDNRQQLITVADSAGRILATAAADPEGLTGTLSGAEAFGTAGARVFATGKFNITAVATFAGPMPYTPADCPVYGTRSGAHCDLSGPALVPAPRAADPLQLPAADLPAHQIVTIPPAAPVEPAPPVVDSPGQAHALAILQDHLLPQQNPSDEPNIATVLLLGPLVRGTGVQTR